MQDDQILQLEDVVQPTVQEVPEEQELPQEETVVAQPQKPLETEQARNFRQLKEAREREEQGRRKAEKERDEAVRYIQQMQSQQQAPVQAEEDDLSINADDFVEGKTVKKVYNEVRELKKQLKQYQQQSTESLAENRLKSMYPDADQVLSRENIASLHEKHPEIANTLVNSTGDSYSKLVTAYTMIKQLGVHQAPDLYQADRDLAQRNAAKPRPLTSIAPQQGDSPMSRANAFANGDAPTPELAKKLHKEMIDAMRRR